MASFETQAAITVTGTAGGLTAALISVGGVTLNHVMIVVETAPIRFTLDGTAPVAGTTGIVAFPGRVVHLFGDEVGLFSAISEWGATATLQCFGARGFNPLELLGPGSGDPNAYGVVRAASGALTAGESTTPLIGLGPFDLAVVQLNVTTITTPDADDEVDFYLQVRYDGTNYADVENIHFNQANNGQTSQKLLVVAGPQSSAVARTRTDGTLADNTKLDIPLGEAIRIKTAVTGATAPTYAYNAQVWFK